MHTRNVNVKTATKESSRKMGEGHSGMQDSVRALTGLYSASMKSGVQVTCSEVSRHGDVQVEIRTDGRLEWRAWSFEPDFLADLERQLRHFVQ